MTAVFLDLDGTLMDSEPGILSSLRHAFHSVGESALAEGDLRWMIGPPFVESFARLGIAEPQRAIDAYRDHYNAGGMFDGQPFDGIFAALDALQSQGRRLYLMTAKPHVYARKITAHFGLAPYLTAEFGPELDGTHNWKAELLAHALRETGERPEASVMVGDRHHDIEAGVENGIPAIAAAWGYGSEEEWSGRAAVAATPADLASTVARLGL